MPQMAPMIWYNLMLTLIMLILLVSLINYFYLNPPKQFTKNLINESQLNWLW